MLERNRRHLVVVLPGIGGSRLVDPSDPMRLIWDATYPDVGNLLLRPHRLSLERHPVLRPMGLIKSKKLFGAWTKIEGYEHLLRSLTDLRGVVLDDGINADLLMHANVVAIGYDFRLGVAKAAEYLHSQIMPRLEALWPKEDDRRGRLIFVAHSMGGLVARYWLAQDNHALFCRELITLGTPHRGAPKALDILANGIAVKGVHLIKGAVRDLLRSWQSMYDLLPTDSEIVDLTQGAPRTVRAAYDLPLAWNGSLATAAREMHRSIRDGWAKMAADLRPSVQPRIGTGHGTQRSCTWDGRRVRVSKDQLDIARFGRWATDLGDGTVPVLSGLPAELPEPPNQFWAEFRHSRIMNSGEVLERIQAAEDYPQIRPTEGERMRMTLGIDLDELLLSGVPTPLSVAVHGVDTSGNPGRCVATVVPDGGSLAKTSTELDWDSCLNGFIGALPGLPSGGYTVRLDWAADDALSSYVSVEAIDPEQRGLVLV